MKVWKAHGLGNDYLVWVSGPSLTRNDVIALCDRHCGVGADGVLEPMPTDRADFGVRIWNPDGSVAEKSGNGLRIFARWLCESRGADRTFTVDTGHDVVGCVVGDDTIEVAMGRAAVRAVRVQSRDAFAVDVGNPHCVVFTQDPLDTVAWRALGEQIEIDPMFPDRTNVQFARVLTDRSIAIRIWERGAGPTQASGSSACAVAAAAVHTGRCRQGPVSVEMPGGTLLVDVSDELTVHLTGPVEVVGTFSVDARWWALRQSAD